MLKSHPRKTLKSHLENVCLIGDKILKNKIVSFTIIDEAKLQSINRLCLLLHDSGKAMQYFQDYIRDIEKELSVGNYSDMKDHGLISGILAYYVAYKLLDDESLSFIVLYVVSHHHGNLSNITDFYSRFRNQAVIDKLEKQYADVNKTALDSIYSELKLSTNFGNTAWTEILNTLNLLKSFRFINRLKKLKSKENYLIINTLFSLLVYADKIEAIYHSVGNDINEFISSMINYNCFGMDIVKDYKLKSFGRAGNPLNLREKAYIDVESNIKNLSLDNGVFSINLPTGSGKTLTALNAAIILQNKISEEKGYIPKIIYLLPFTSIIEQNYKVFCNVLNTDIEKTIIKHHYLSHRNYAKSSEDQYEYEIGEHFIESWDSQIIVSTFVQLFHSIFTNRNRQLKKFHNIINSIIILDEVQSIPFKYWNLIKEIFSLMFEHLGCYFILMTATMPLIFSEKDKEIIELASDKRAYFNSFNRLKLNCKMLKDHINIDKFNRIIEGDVIANSDRSFLIVLNTIKSSIAVWNHLEPRFRNLCKLFYLSSNIVPKEKQKRIDEIKNYKGRKIIISTQVIEAGVDIDLDVVYRDFGPFDSINQTAGRCNREGGKTPGIVKIVSLVDENNKGKPYSNYIYDSLLLDRSQKTLEGISEIEEKDIIFLSEKYFEQLHKYGDNQEGTNVINMIESLRYKDAFEYTENKDKNKKVFSLIKADFKAIEVFIEVDNDAEKVWQQYSVIKKTKDRFERKKRFSEIKKEFSQYVISVPEIAVKKHFNIDDKDFIVYVSKNMIDTTYDKFTGFIRGEIEDYMM